ncbi:hypothetical protein AVEN_224859-1 [Araneus ventricosus]|uniref:Uncharacterized protein n=1 Tax=Araneus ventricosus TaxID=182803 RepID=A0A4Y2NV48_ARAVE|nr:hypothetical protein AVEN_224859-1 [Araneus ventricosus]
MVQTQLVHRLSPWPTPGYLYPLLPPLLPLPSLRHCWWQTVDFSHEFKTNHVHEGGGSKSVGGKCPPPGVAWKYERGMSAQTSSWPFDKVQNMRFVPKQFSSLFKVGLI